MKVCINSIYAFGFSEYVCNLYDRSVNLLGYLMKRCSNLVAKCWHMLQNEFINCKVASIDIIQEKSKTCLLLLVGNSNFLSLYYYLLKFFSLQVHQGFSNY